MKNLRYIIFGLLLATSASSCKKYLTVNPKTELRKDLMFSTESGFKDALTGVYIQMKNDAGYGKALTMTTMEHLISSWDVESNSMEDKLGKFNYSDANVDNAMGNIFAQQYKVIASINAILENIDKQKQVFKTQEMYQIIKGECLALRAYCHLDLLRLFGPVPGVSGSGSMLPYVTTLSSKPNGAVSYEVYKNALLNDLSEAEALQKDIDPFIKYSIDNFRANNVFTPEDNYISYRYLRMNYYAVKALQARAYLWFQDNGKAYECARVVIDAKNTNGSDKFRLGKAGDMAAGDYVLTCEHIFGLYDFALFAKYNTTFDNARLKKGTSEVVIKGQLYGNTGTDIREANLWKVVPVGQPGSYILKKYLVTDTASKLSVDYKQIPLLRASEMYLIAMETGPVSQTQLLWNTFRSARGLQPASMPASPDLLKNELIKEYRKEFYAEGQAFYAYKRINAAKALVLFSPSGVIVNYTPPIPRTESSLNN